MMILQANQVLEILDKEDRPIGRLTLETRDGNLLSGKFSPGPNFSEVAAIFRGFEEAVNSQTLGAVDKFDQAIGNLGLHLRLPQTSQNLEVQDVQIWNDGGMSCRLR
jgi:hypothetical protein